MIQRFTVLLLVFNFIMQSKLFCCLRLWRPDNRYTRRYCSAGSLCQTVDFRYARVQAARCILYSINVNLLSTTYALLFETRSTIKNENIIFRVKTVCYLCMYFTRTLIFFRCLKRKRHLCWRPQNVSLSLLICLFRNRSVERPCRFHQ